MKRFAFIQHLNWRVLLLRVLVNAIALLVTSLFLPHIYFLEPRLLSLLWMALVLGVINALVRPVVQFLTLPFIFATYGVVVVLINAGLLWLLSVLFPSLFAVDGLIWALVGGAVIGLLSSFLESLLGVTPPIVPEKYDSVRQRIRSQPPALPAVLAQATSSGDAPGALVVPAAGRPAPAPTAPAGAPSVREPRAAGAEAGPEPAPADGGAPAATTAEELMPADAAPGAVREAPGLESTGSEE